MQNYFCAKQGEHQMFLDDEMTDDAAAMPAASDDTNMPAASDEMTDSADETQHEEEATHEEAPSEM